MSDLLKEDLDLTISSDSDDSDNDNLSVALASSSNSNSGEDDNNEDEADLEIRRMLAEEIINFKLVGSLPPTPRPMTRTSSLSSLSSIISMSSNSSPQKKEITAVQKKHVPVPCKNFKTTKAKKTERDICRDFGISLDDPDFETFLDDREDEEKAEAEKSVRVGVDLDDGIFIKPQPKTKKPKMKLKTGPGPGPSSSPSSISSASVKNVVDELINMGGKGDGESENVTTPRKCGRKRMRKPPQPPKEKPPPSTTRGEKRWNDLKFTPGARCAVIKDDVETVRKTKDAIDALVAVLEKTRAKLIDDDKDLLYTEPPFRIRKEKAKIDIRTKAN